MAQLKIIGSIGDVNPIEYGGGIVFDDGETITLEYTYGLEDIEDDGDENPLLDVYQVTIEDDVFDYHNWADPAEMATTLGTTASELRKAGKSSDPMQRVLATEDIASHYGWDELDSYPYQMTAAGLEKSWDLEDM